MWNREKTQIGWSMHYEELEQTSQLWGSLGICIWCHMSPLTCNVRIWQRKKLLQILQIKVFLHMWSQIISLWTDAQESLFAAESRRHNQDFSLHLLTNNIHTSERRSDSLPAVPDAIVECANFTIAGVCRLQHASRLLLSSPGQDEGNKIVIWMGLKV